LLGVVENNEALILIELVLKELPQRLRTQVDMAEFIWADDDVNRMARDLGSELNSYVVAYDTNSCSLDNGKSLCSMVEEAELDGNLIQRIQSVELSLLSKGIAFVVYKRPLKVREYV
jgi:hypothetical protein